MGAVSLGRYLSSALLTGQEVCMDYRECFKAVPALAWLPHKADYADGQCQTKQ